MAAEVLRGCATPLALLCMFEPTASKVYAIMWHRLEHFGDQGASQLSAATTRNGQGLGA